MSNSSPGKEFILTLFTRDPQVARAADTAGVNRIGVDLESEGKSKRQAGRLNWLSDHSLADLPVVRLAVKQGELFVRLNGWNAGGKEELQKVLEIGAEVIMLPYFHSADVAREFIDAIDDRALPVLLLETREAIEDLDDILSIDAEFECHIGLNDLGLSMGYRNPFSLLANPVIFDTCARVRSSGHKCCIGRVARIDDDSLPIASREIIAYMVRHGAAGSFLSSYFLRNGFPADITWMTAHVSALRGFVDELGCTPKEVLEPRVLKFMSEIAGSIGHG